jgi:hypothetical protein
MSPIAKPGALIAGLIGKRQSSRLVVEIGSMLRITLE